MSKNEITWWWLIHEVDLQLVLALLAEQRLVLIQLLLLVILRSQVSLRKKEMRAIYNFLKVDGYLCSLFGLVLLLGLPKTLLIVLRGGMEELFAHVIVVAFPHLEN